jgi:glycosyltransferase involved in cell wall biosynthesis
LRDRGEGPLRSSLEALIAHHDLGEIVHLRGGLPQEEVRSLFGSASIFVLPCVVESNGNRDGIPVALMEALASGVPVISTDVSGIPELVEHEVTGLVVPPKDARALALAIEHLLSDQPLRACLAQQARQRVEQNHDVRVNTRRKVELFRQAIAREN